MNETDIDGRDSTGFLVDSSGWIEYFLDGPNADEFGKYIEDASPRNFYTPTIVIYEIYKKLLRDAGEEEALCAVAHLKNSTTIIDLTDDLVIDSAETSLREKIPMADAIILSTARYMKATLVTGDGDFREIDEVVYIGDK